MNCNRSRSAATLRSLGLLTFGLLAAPATTYAQTFPSKPIRFVAPTPPSTPPDIISRIINVVEVP